MKISDSIHQAEVGGASLRLLHRPVDSVVTVAGSFETRSDPTRRDDILQEVVVELLDKGTTERDRFEIASEIEDRGADVGFGSHNLSVHFAARVLKQDVGDVLQIVAEQLRTPAFAEEEFEKAKHQLGSKIRRSLESTAVRAGSAMAAALFAPGHPNHGYSPQEDIEVLSDITLDDVRRYHEQQFGANRLALCAAGDLDVRDFERAVASAFAGFDKRIDTSDRESDAYGHLVRIPRSDRIEIAIPDRMNLDVRIGCSVDLRRDHPDFVPLHVGNYVLGGNFSARLMSYVREELGLTYGISSGLGGFDVEYGGFWQIGVTLSQENLAKGIEATMATVEQFVENGITADELAAKQRTLSGLFKVGLSTTRGLAQTMHAHFRTRRAPSYIDEYPEIISGLNVDQVNEAIRSYLQSDRLVTAIAGTTVAA
jgi:zinc protease